MELVPEADKMISLQTQLNKLNLKLNAERDTDQNQNRLLLLKGPEFPFLLVLRDDKLHIFNLNILTSEEEKLNT